MTIFRVNDFVFQLFDFDIEVKPILEVLVGKTVEQALLEVMEEEELSNLRAQQRQFEELRNAELVETQRLEEQERRHREEKERRMRQQAEVLRKEKETGEKIAARAFAQVSSLPFLYTLGSADLSIWVSMATMNYSIKFVLETANIHFGIQGRNRGMPTCGF